MYELRKYTCLCSMYLMVCAPMGAGAAQASAQHKLQAGFALAQACEHEIDDDMAMYEECIGHAMNRVTGDRHVLLGIHFQAWLIADLAARQNSPRAATLRKLHQQGVTRQLRATQLKLGELCRVKSIPCAHVRTRMYSRLG
jgi:hypothetical protein